MLKQKLNQRKVVAGTWCELPSPAAVNVIAKAGLDFVIIDMEHGPMDFKVAQEMVMACQAEGSEAIIRVPANSEESALKALDLGAAGILMPHIKTARDAKLAASFSLFPPLGQRSYNPYTRGLGYSGEANTNEKNKNTIFGVLVEDETGVKNLAKICAVEAVDFVYLGIYDLAMSMGYGDIKNEQVSEVAESAVKSIVACGKSAACMVHTAEEVEYYSGLGVSVFVYKVDTGIIFDAYSKFSKIIKS